MVQAPCCESILAIIIATNYFNLLVSQNDTARFAGLRREMAELENDRAPVKKRKIEDACLLKRIFSVLQLCVLERYLCRISGNRHSVCRRFTIDTLMMFKLFN